jgi:DNA-binding IclR family transcriptional regulator
MLLQRNGVKGDFVSRAEGKLKIRDDAPPAALKGVRRALAVLEHIAVHPGRATDVAADLGLSWATLHRTLSELEQGGFLQRARESNRYVIGPRMWLIGTAYLAGHPVLEAARPYLEAAVGHDEIVVQLVERADRYAVTLYSHQTSDETITKADYGHHFPLHCGAKGQVLLAFAPAAFVDAYLGGPLEMMTPKTETDPKVLRERLSQIRLNGYAQSKGDVQIFTGSIAAPVWDRDGQAVAAVSFIGRKSAFGDAARTERLLESLLTTAQSISIGLGWRPGDGRAGTG